MIRRWTVAVSLIAALLVNIVFGIGCGTASAIEITASSSSAADELPDCCRDGMCPYHAQEQHSHHSKNPADSCICDMFSRDSATFMVLSAMPALVSVENQQVVVLPPVGSALALFVPDAADAILMPSTPPPRA
jgi:hypothetical protein